MSHELRLDDWSPMTRAQQRALDERMPNDWDYLINPWKRQAVYLVRVPDQPLRTRRPRSTGEAPR